VGFDHDAEYLGFLGRKLFSLVSAVPPEVAHCRDVVQFRTRTLLHLLADENLRLISVWSPTFLTTLLEDFVARQDKILKCCPDADGPGRRGAPNSSSPWHERAGARSHLIKCGRISKSSVVGPTAQVRSTLKTCADFFLVWKFKAKALSQPKLCFIAFS